MYKQDCVFCKISKGEIKNKRIYENDNFFSVFDINPKTEGHCLIISKKHYENVLDMPETLGQELIDAIKKTVELLRKEHDFDGFNIINNNFEAAGQVVKHVHFHILLRKKNDGLEMIA
ncbi:MAG: HIT domain-containing protein [Nanoarchaeota archaeon]